MGLVFPHSGGDVASLVKRNPLSVIRSPLFLIFYANDILHSPSLLPFWEVHCAAIHQEECARTTVKSNCKKEETKMLRKYEVSKPEMEGRNRRKGGATRDTEPEKSQSRTGPTYCRFIGQNGLYAYTHTVYYDVLLLRNISSGYQRLRRMLRTNVRVCF